MNDIAIGLMQFWLIKCAVFVNVAVIGILIYSKI